MQGSGDVVIPIRREGKRVAQKDLEELIYLRHLLDDAHETWIAKREEVLRAIEEGALIESGVHWALLVESKGRRRLLVR